MIPEDAGDERSLEPLLLASELAVAVMGKTRGAEWIARQARTQGLVCEDQTPISSQLISQWLTEIRLEKAPPEASKRYEALLNQTLPFDAEHTFADLLVRARQDARLREHCMALAKGLIRFCGDAATGSAD